MVQIKSSSMKVSALPILFFALLLSISSCFSMDLVRWNHGNIDTDKRRDYKVEVITQALEKTIPLYGAYRLTEANQTLVPQRALQQVQEGQSINIFMAVTSPEWESKTIPIRIPIRRGILNYRLLAINKTSLHEFEKVKTNESLKNHKVGLGRGWATVSLMTSHGHSVVQKTTLNGLYEALSHYQIDYIPRGINEVFDEMVMYGAANRDLIIEPNVAIRTLAPYYIFVSPKEERLAERLRVGLEMMVADKSLKALFDEFYADKIANAGLSARRIIRIDNPNISAETPIARKELWFEYDE